MQLEYDRGPRNDLLEYLRSLDSDMVIISLCNGVAIFTSPIFSDDGMMICFNR